MLGEPDDQGSHPGGLMKRRLNLLANVDGQGLAEYALILALIAIVAIDALLFLGDQISRILNQIGGSI
jgi:Flp pilus assembly pilin Flp